jgi:hypothetical protein
MVLDTKPPLPMCLVTNGDYSATRKKWVSIEILGIQLPGIAGGSQTLTLSRLRHAGQQRLLRRRNVAAQEQGGTGGQVHQL